MFVQKSVKAFKRITCLLSFTYIGYYSKRQKKFFFNDRSFLELPINGKLHPWETLTWQDIIHFDFSHIDVQDPSKAIFAVSKKEQQVMREIFRTLGYSPDDPLVERLKRLPRKGHRKGHKRCYLPRKTDPRPREIFTAKIRGNGKVGKKNRHLTLDTDGLEIWVDWMEMLTRFFGCVEVDEACGKTGGSSFDVHKLISNRTSVLVYGAS